MLLRTLDANVLGNMLTGKQVISAGNKVHRGVQEF